VDQEGPDVSISAFGDAEETRSPATRVVPWHKTKPGRELTAIAERGGIAGRRDKRGGGQGAYTLNALETSACFTVFAEPPDPLVIGTNPVVSSHKLVLKIQNERPDQWIEWNLFGS